MKEAPLQNRYRVLFQDECTFGRISDTRRCWAPAQKRPIVGHQVIREYVYSLAAVCPKDGAISSLIMPWVDAEVMLIFLQHTAQQYPQDYCLMFLDGAGWHRANNLQVPLNMKLLYLPPYSPELNPVEPLWRHLRENYFGNDVFDTLEAVEDRLCDGLKNLSTAPEIVKSITQFDWLKLYV